MLAAVFTLGLTAATASAEETPHFIKAKKEITEVLKANTTVSEFFIEVPALKSQILCEGLKSESSVGAKWTSHVTLKFEKCTTSGVEFAECKVVEPVTFTLTGQLVYKGGKKTEEIYDIFYHTGFEGVFATIKFEGPECALAGEMIPIKGSAIGLPAPKSPGEEAEKIKITFAGSAMPSAKYTDLETGKVETAGGVMKFGTLEAYLKGLITIELGTKEKYGAE